MRVGAVDIGTNSIGLLVAEPGAEGGLRWLDRRIRVVGLGRGVDATGRFGEEAMARAVGVLDEYRGALEEHGAERFRVVATSATREAANREDFLSRAERILGTRPEVITGDEEARLSYRGATAELPPEASPYLVVDLGGGSTEFVYGDGEPSYVVSVNVGSVRLTERAVPDRPAPPEQLERAEALLSEALAAVRLPGPVGTCVGVAGTFASLAAIHLDLSVYDPERVHGSVLGRGTLDELVDRLSTLTVEETAAIPSLDPGRAPVLLAGALVARRAPELSGVGEVRVSERNILDGVALSVVELLRRTDG